jgi:RNA polymerase sigma factor for flagellar operon FliA
MKSSVRNKRRINKYTSYERNGRKEALINQHLYLVQREAQRMFYHISMKVPIEDLIGGGTIGLIKAVESFEEKEGSSFKKYAKKKIRGSIIDELRKMDILPRGVRKRKQRIEQAIGNLSTRQGRMPRESEIADELDVTVETYRSWELEGSLADLIENGGSGVSTNDGFEDLNGSFEVGKGKGLSEDHRDVLKHVEETLTGLPERERLIITLYYYEDLTMKEIGKVFSISESRVSQIHNEIMMKLRKKLKGLDV